MSAKRREQTCCFNPSRQFSTQIALFGAASEMC
jgi:hypothetical protein